MKARKLLAINVVVTGSLATLLFLAYVFYVRYIARSEPVSYQQDYLSIENCRNSSHFKVSSEQAHLLNKPLKTLEDYCISRSDLPPISSKQYWDYHYYSLNSFSSELINFNDSFNFNSRKTPCSDKIPNNKDSKQIWAFGGSTLEDITTIDSLTIANSICEVFRTHNYHIRVHNFGTGGFSSETELIKFLNLYKLSIRNRDRLPDYALFYNGYNDSNKLYICCNVAGLPQYMSFQFFVQNTIYVPFSETLLLQFFASLRKTLLSIFDQRPNRFLTAIDRLIDHHSFRLKQKFNPALSTTVHPSTTLDGKLLLSSAYIHDQNILAAVCSSLKVHCVTVLQPLLATRSHPVGSIEKEVFMRQEEQGKNKIIKRFYFEVSSELKSLDKSSFYYTFIDLSGLFDNARYSSIPIFFDFGHVGFFASDLIGKEIGNAILKRRVLSK
jgi:hypothetical protein